MHNSLHSTTCSVRYTIFYTTQHAQSCAQFSIHRALGRNFTIIRKPSEFAIYKMVSHTKRGYWKANPNRFVDFYLPSSCLAVLFEAENRNLICFHLPDTCYNYAHRRFFFLMFHYNYYCNMFSSCSIFATITPSDDPFLTYHYNYSFILIFYCTPSTSVTVI